MVTHDNSRPARHGRLARWRVLWAVLACCLAGAGCDRDAAAARRGTLPGEQMTLTIGGQPVTFCWIPAGKFMMGSPETEPGRAPDETPRIVTIRQGFWLAMTECTQAVWQQVMGRQPSEFYGEALLPVERVSWDDCADFLTRIQRHAPDPHWRFELPTEAQWEYACRAGCPAPFARSVNAVAWNALNSDDRTHPVGRLQPNAWGLADMQGNVAEWCRDGEPARPGTGRPNKDSAAARARQAAEAGFRVIRGGSWASSWDCRAAARNSDCASLSINRVGFRIALVAAPH